MTKSGMQVPLSELQNRLARFRTKMDQLNPDWEIAAIFNRVNQYYFTGTMQEGMLLLPRNDEAVLWVRRSFERAKDESLFPQIKPMDSFRDAAGSLKSLSRTIYLETETVPLAFYQRFKKYFPFDQVRSADPALAAIRALKSPYELALMEKSGEIHRRILEERAPQLLREGMSEADFASALFSIMIAEGHHGVSRFAAFGTEIGPGLFCFGESSLYPTSFNGPGGNFGMSPAVPFFGSRQHTLKPGDLVFVDIGCGLDGYHTDKTMTYMFGQPLPKEVITIHNRCVDLQDQIAAQLKPGAIPSQIYNNTINNLDPDFLENFMGFGARRSKFLGHGIGLVVDEYPVIAEGFDEPLEEGMVFAIEPKKGIKGIGMVGIENTFLVTPNGGKSITGVSRGLIEVF